MDDIIMYTVTIVCQYTAIVIMKPTSIKCDDDDDDDDDNDDNSNNDGSLPFIVLFAISVVINILLTIAIIYFVVRVKKTSYSPNE